MSVYADDIAAAAEDIRELGQLVTLLKRGEATGPANNPTYGPDIPTPIHLVEFHQKRRDAEGTTRVVREVMISPEVQGVEPEEGDRVRMTGGVAVLTNLMPFAPDGTVIYWTAELTNG